MDFSLFFLQNFEVFAWKTENSSKADVLWWDFSVVGFRVDASHIQYAMTIMGRDEPVCVMCEGRGDFEGCAGTHRDRQGSGRDDFLCRQIHPCTHKEMQYKYTHTTVAEISSCVCVFLCVSGKNWRSPRASRTQRGQWNFCARHWFHFRGFMVPRRQRKPVPEWKKGQNNAAISCCCPYCCDIQSNLWSSIVYSYFSISSFNR